MALNWSKHRTRQQANRAASDQAEIARMLAEHDQEPSKAELRAETAELVAAYRGPIRRLPTFRDIKCACGHRARVPTRPGTSPRFRCSKCGARAL